MKISIYIFIAGLILSGCGTGSQITQATQLKDSAQNLMKLKQYEAAIAIAGKAAKRFKQSKNPAGRAEAFFLMARASALSGDFRKAVDYGETGNNLAQQLENYKLEYNINNTLSWAYFSLGKSFKEQQHHYDRQLVVVDKLGIDKEKAQVYNNYSYDATVAGAVPLGKIITYMKFANDYYATTENNKGRWYTLMNLCWQFRLQPDLVQSEYFGRLAAMQAEKEQDRHAIIEANTQLGETLLLQDKIVEAKTFYEKALAQSEQKTDRDKYVFDVYYARYLWALDKKPEAIKRLKDAIKFLEAGEVFYEMLGRAYLADFSFRNNDIEEAQKQINVIKSPRAGYFSVETKVLADITEAKLIGLNDKRTAIALLEHSLKQIDSFGATLLEQKIQLLVDEMRAAV